MKTLLTCNETTKTVRLGDTDWASPILTFGESLTLALRLTRTVAGTEIEPAYTVTSLQASVGFIDARPLARKWALQIGPGAQSGANTTAQLDYNASAAALQAAINALSGVVTAYGTATVRVRDGSYDITFATASAAVAMQIRDNDLFPRCFAEIGSEQIDGVWHHEVRLTQLVVDQVAVGERILPAIPTIARIQAGNTSNGFAWNEIQRLKVSPDFRATYYLTLGYGRTVFLSVADGADVILTALTNALGANFAVTLADDFTYDIEFIGVYAGKAQSLLGITVEDNPPPGDFTFTLQLDRRALLHWLRQVAIVELPLEVVMVVTELVAGETVTTTLVPVSTTIFIRRPLNWPVIEAAPDIDLTRPTSPKDYKLFNPDNLIVGQEFYQDEVGNGTDTVFAITDGLDTTVKHVWVTENTTNGKQLIEGTDYEVRITDANAVEVTALDGAPATDAWMVIVFSAQTVGAFAEGLTIAMDQVTGLEARFTALESAVSDLQTLLPSGTLVRPATVSTPDSIEIPDTFILFPNARLAPEFEPSSAAGLTGKALATFPTADLRPPGLLPALRDTSVTTISSLPGSPTSGAVYQNTGGSAIAIPGGLGRRGSSLAVNGFAGYDGRVWYALTRGTTPGSSTSYFPADFEQELIAPLTFERDTWRAGQIFSLEFKLALQVIRATTNAQWTLVVEHGTTPSETDATVTAIDITTAGTGTHSLLANGTTIGTFTANATTNVFTLAAHGCADGEIVQLSNTGGALPGGLTAAKDYVVRDATTDTFKLAELTTTLNLQNIVWNATPLLTQRLVLSALKQTRKFGARVLRSTANVITAEALKSGSWEAAGSTPATPRFALRVRLVNFDTENSVTGAKGYAFAALTSAQATIG